MSRLRRPRTPGRRVHDWGSARTSPRVTALRSSVRGINERSLTFLIWHAEALATGAYGRHVVPCTVIDYELATPDRRAKLHRTLVQRAPKERWAQAVLARLHERGYLDSAPPRAPRGRPRLDPHDAAGLESAHRLLRRLGLRACEADEVVADWLGYDGDAALESTRKRVLRYRQVAARAREEMREGAPLLPFLPWSRVQPGCGRGGERNVSRLGQSGSFPRTMRGEDRSWYPVSTR